jgi:hypothetical protein
LFWCYSFSIQSCLSVSPMQVWGWCLVVLELSCGRWWEGSSPAGLLDGTPVGPWGRGLMGHLASGWAAASWARGWQSGGAVAGRPMGSSLVGLWNGDLAGRQPCRFSVQGTFRAGAWQWSTCGVGSWWARRAKAQQAVAQLFFQ